MPRTLRIPPLTHEEALAAAQLIDRCENRLGPFRGRAGAARQRVRLFKFLDRPTEATWKRAYIVFITAGAGQLSLGQAVNLYTDFDSESGPYPTRQQAFTALDRACRA